MTTYGIDGVAIAPASDGPAPAPAARRWLPWAALAVLGVALIAAAGWWGFRSQQAAWLQPVTPTGSVGGAASAASSAPPTSGPLAAMTGSTAAERPPVAPSGDRPGGADGATVPLRWPLWEFKLQQAIPPRTPSLTPPNWRMTGATLSKGVWSVIVMHQGRTEPEYLTVGQSLPGGYRIEHIDDEGVTLVHGKQKMLLSYLNAR